MGTAIRFIVLLAIASATSYATAQTTRFTYQGKLTDSGAPQAAYQMQFKLFDAAAAGSQIGSTVENASVSVTDGIFSVNLDFGANVFSGADRYLEIGVRRNAGESYVTLSNRQQIASTPYSIRTLSAQQADVALDAQKLGGVAANQYVTTTAVGNAFVRNDTALQTANFNISGNGTIGTQLGIGRAASGGIRTDSQGTIRSIDSISTSILAETTGGTNAWARFYAITPSQRWAWGSSQNFNGNQFYLVDDTFGASRMTIQPGGGAIAFPFGNVAIGSPSPPASRLFVNGGPVWTNNGWGASLELASASAIGWRPNGSNQSFGIGQTGGGLYFFRTPASPGNPSGALTYDMLINDQGNVGVGTVTPNAKLTVVGNVTQDAGSFGVPKAMVFVLANGTMGRCYNGFLGQSATPNGSATTGCGIAISGSAGLYKVNFGVPVGSRFFVATPHGDFTAKSVQTSVFNSTTVEVSVTDSPTGVNTVSDLTLILY
jgi:hypothetical protein